MRNEKVSKKNKKVKSYRKLASILTFVIIVVAIIFAMSVFFKVSNITVEGNALYTDEEIISASGIDEGDTLFFVNRGEAASKIFAKLPYVSQVTVVRGLPNRVVIQVTESQAMAYIMIENTAWTLDQNCKVLESASIAEVATLIKVDGIELFAPTIGEIASTVAADANKITYLSDILYQIKNRNMEDMVTYINMETITNPEFSYMGRFTVKLGGNDNTEYKFGLLEAAVAQLKDGDSGTFDLSIDKQAHFSPN